MHSRGEGIVSLRLPHNNAMFLDGDKTNSWKLQMSPQPVHKQTFFLCARNMSKFNSYCMD